MDSAPLIKNGISYVTAKAAAPGAGISADYITKLCRKGEVNAVVVGNTWYVDEASLADFIARKEATKKEQAARNAEHMRKLHRRPDAERTEALSSEPRPQLHKRELIATSLSPEAQHAQIQRRRAEAFARRTTRPNLARTFVLATFTLLFAMSVTTAALIMPTQATPALASVASVADVGRSLINTFTSFFDSIFAVNEYVIPPAWERTIVQPRTSAATTAQLAPARIVQQPIIERIVEKTQTIVQSVSSGLSEQLLEARLATLETYLVGRIDVLAYQGDRQAESLADSFADGIGGAGFDDIDITDSTFTGGSISGASISGASLSGTTFSGETDFTSLTVTVATSTNATSTNLYVSSSFGFGTDTGLLRNDAGAVSTLANGSNGQVLKIVGGALAWGTDLTGGGGGSDAWATTSDSLAVYPSDPTQVVLVGSSATSTTGNILEVAGNSLFRSALTSYGLLSAPRFTATSSVASIFPYASTTALSATAICLSADCRNAWPTDTSFSTTSADYWKSVSNFFSTTSADFWETQQAPRGVGFSTTSANYWRSVTDLFSTSSANYFLSANQGLAFSTTSADAWKDARNFFASSSADYFIASSSTIPKTYTANAFTALQTFGSASTTNISATYASSTQGFFGSLSIGSLSGFLKATAGAIATAAVDLASDVTGILGVARGGTGWAAVEAGSVLYGNGSSALATTTAGTSGQVLALVGNVPTWVATSTLATISGTLDVSKGGTGATSFSYGLVLSPGGASALTNIATSSLGLLTTHVAEGSALYYTDARVQTYLGTLDKGFFFSTTSADHWQSQRNFFSTTSASYFVSVNQDSLFSTTSAIYFAHSSTTLPKTYTANAFTALQTFANASSSILSADILCLSTDCRTSWPASGSLTGTQGQVAYFSGANTAVGTSSLFIATSGDIGIGTTSPYAKLTAWGGASGNIFEAVASASTTALSISGTGNATTTIRGLNINGQATSTSNVGFNLSAGCYAISGACISGGGGVSFAYPFPSNATSTTLSLSSGLLSLASTTIGSGAQAGGLTISGGATTSGSLYVAGNVGIGMQSPADKLTVSGGNIDILDASAALTFRNRTDQGLFDEAFGLQLMAPENVIIGIDSNNNDTANIFAIVTNTSTLYGDSSDPPPSALFLVNEIGNVGIGTTSPNYKLDVNGDVNIAAGSCYRVNGTCINGVSSDLQEFTATGADTWEKPTGFSPGSLVYIEAWGGGGSGGKGNASQSGGGGGGGAYNYRIVPLSSLSATESVTVASGGAGQTTAGTPGNAGGTSSFGSVVTAYGGGGGGWSAVGGGGGGGGGIASVGITSTNQFGANGGGPGEGAGGAVADADGGMSVYGGGGGAAGDATSNVGGSSAFGGGGGGGGHDGGGSATANVGGASTWGGGGGGGSAISGTGGNGGTSVYGGNGSAGAVDANSSSAGSQPGGGSGGVENGTSSGSGGAGMVRVRVFPGADLAENYPVVDPAVEFGDIVEFDPGAPGFIRRASRFGQPLAGVISTNPEIVLGDKDTNGRMPVALAGRTPVKFTNENGPVAVGDRITISSTPGIGMKAGPFDDSVGVVIGNVEPLAGGSVVVILVDPQQGIDINALALNLVGEPVVADIASSTAASTATSAAATATPPARLDFVGGMMQAVAARLDALAANEMTYSSTIATSTSASSTPQSPSDSYTATLMRSIFTRMTAWLADTANGIQSIVAKLLKAERAELQELCLGSTCVTEAQLQALLGRAAAAAAPQSGDSSTSNQGAFEPINPSATTATTSPDTAQAAGFSATSSPSETDPDLTHSVQTDTANWTPPEPANDNPAPPELSDDNQPSASEDPGAEPSNDNAQTPSAIAI